VRFAVSVNKNMPQFQNDLSFGKEWENTVAFLLQKRGFGVRPIEGYDKEKDIVVEIPIEVKCDRLVHKTGNFAIEYRYKGQNSGILATKALFWVICDEKDCYLVQTSVLRQKMREMQEMKRLLVVKGGDDKLSEMVLLPKEVIYNYFPKLN